MLGHGTSLVEGSALPEGTHASGVPDHVGHCCHPDGVGVPAFRDQLAAARARAAAEQLYAAMQYARSMAQRYGSVVTLCPVVDPAEEYPRCGGHFGHNWSVITNRLGRPRLARDWGECPPTAPR